MMRARAISFAASQRAYDAMSDDPKPVLCCYCGRPSTEGVDASGRHLCQRCVDDGVCVRCGEDEGTQERDGRRVCVDCARDIDLDFEADEPERAAQGREQAGR